MISFRESSFYSSAKFSFGKECNIYRQYQIVAFSPIFLYSSSCCLVSIISSSAHSREKYWPDMLIHAASETRPVDPQYAAEHRIMFSDGYPFLLISRVSDVQMTLHL